MCHCVFTRSFVETLGLSFGFCGSDVYLCGSRLYMFIFYMLSAISTIRLDAHRVLHVNIRDADWHS
jgi:hypothetical protein